MVRTDLFLEKVARERQFEMECEMRLQDDVSLMVDDGDMSLYEMPVEGAERA